MTDRPLHDADSSTIVFLRRYQAILLLLSGMLMGSVALFSRDSDFFPTQPRPKYKIALTFDDGPHPAFTDRLLRALEQERAAATFFVVGKQVDLYPNLIRDIHRNGHEIASHTYNHLNFDQMNPTLLSEELDRTQTSIRTASGVDVRYFRPPGGRFDKDSIREIGRKGYRMVLWTVLPQDHRALPADLIYQRVMDGAQDGGVILLHSGMENTLAMLPRLIHDLRKKGFEFYTISEMLDSSGSAVWLLPRHSDMAAATASQPAS